MGQGQNSTQTMLDINRKLHTGVHGLLVSTFWVLLINLTNMLLGLLGAQLKS